MKIVLLDTKLELEDLRHVVRGYPCFFTRAAHTLCLSNSGEGPEVSHGDAVGVCAEEDYAGQVAAVLVSSGVVFHTEYFEFTSLEEAREELTDGVEQ